MKSLRQSVGRKRHRCARMGSPKLRMRPSPAHPSMKVSPVKLNGTLARVPLATSSTAGLKNQESRGTIPTSSFPSARRLVPPSGIGSIEMPLLTRMSCAAPQKDPNQTHPAFNQATRSSRLGPRRHRRQQSCAASRRVPGSPSGAFRYIERVCFRLVKPGQSRIFFASESANDAPSPAEACDCLVRTCSSHKATWLSASNVAGRVVSRSTRKKLPLVYQSKLETAQAIVGKKAYLGTHRLEFVAASSVLASTSGTPPETGNRRIERAGQPD
jgi:hypothetical protein